MGAVPSAEGQRAGPTPLAAGEVARYVVAAAVWAPSVHNTLWGARTASTTSDLQFLNHPVIFMPPTRTA